MKARTFFPRRDGKRRRFRLDCQRTRTSYASTAKLGPAQRALKNGKHHARAMPAQCHTLTRCCGAVRRGAGSQPVLLASYNIDGFFLPEWVAFRIERPMFGAAPRAQCLPASYCDIPIEHH
jgi:hypothetical protein